MLSIHPVSAMPELGFGFMCRSCLHYSREGPKTIPVCDAIEAEEVIRKALAPPPPTKEEALEVVRFLDMNVSALGTCRQKWETKRELLCRYIASMGENP